MEMESRAQFWEMEQRKSRTGLYVMYDVWGYVYCAKDKNIKAEI